MNRTELSEILELPEEQLLKMLQGCSIPELDDYSEHLETLEGVKAVMIETKGKSWSKALETWKERSAIAPQASQTITQNQTPIGIPVGGTLSEEWRKAAKEEADLLRARVAGAPFDGIFEAADELGAEAKVQEFKQHGRGMFFEELDLGLNDPDFAHGFSEDLRKKRQASRSKPS